MDVSAGALLVAIFLLHGYPRCAAAKSLFEMSSLTGCSGSVVARQIGNPALAGIASCCKKCAKANSTFCSAIEYIPLDETCRFLPGPVPGAATNGCAIIFTKRNTENWRQNATLPTSPPAAAASSSAPRATTAYASSPESTSDAVPSLPAHVTTGPFIGQTSVADVSEPTAGQSSSQATLRSEYASTRSSASRPLSSAGSDGASETGSTTLQPLLSTEYFASSYSDVAFDTVSGSDAQISLSDNTESSLANSSGAATPPSDRSSLRPTGFPETSSPYATSTAISPTASLSIVHVSTSPLQSVSRDSQSGPMATHAFVNSSIADGAPMTSPSFAAYATLSASTQAAQVSTSGASTSGHHSETAGGTVGSRAQTMPPSDAPSYAPPSASLTTPETFHGSSRAAVSALTFPPDEPAPNGTTQIRVVGGGSTAFPPPAQSTNISNASWPTGNHP